MVKHKRDITKKLPPFVARVLGLLLPLGPVQARAMFGAHGLYLDGLIFAVVTKDGLFFKIDAISRDRFIKKGCEPLTYEGRSGTIALPYYETPAGTLNSTKRLLPWAELGLEAARRITRDKVTKKRRN